MDRVLVCLFGLLRFGSVLFCLLVCLFGCLIVACVCLCAWLVGGLLVW